MMYEIWLFDATTGAKVAFLQNAFSIKRSEKENCAPSLEFSLPADDAKAIYLTPAHEAKIYNTKKARWEGLYKIGEGEDRWNSSGSLINVYYSGALIQLEKTENISYDTTAVPKTPTQIITALLALQEFTPAITVGTIQPTTSIAFAIENANLLAAILKLPEYLGGYIEVDDTRHLNWYNEPSTTTPTREVRYTKNMRGVSRKRDYTAIRNRIYAYGYGEGDAQLTLLDAGETYEYIESIPSQTSYGIAVKRITDLRIIHPSTLLRYAQKYLADHKDPVVSYQVDCVNLAAHSDFLFDYESLEVGQIVRVINSDISLNVNVKLVSVETDLSKAENITLELSTLIKDISDSFRDVQRYQNIAENVACQISAGNVIVQGTFTVDGWRSAGTTTIDGGKITASTISSSALNFSLIGTDNVVASINASIEGITINANRIKINGDCTFTAGYDPTGRVLGVGGTYDSAASGARVRIFPDANTGILITDGTNDVFKALVGGTDVGDVIIGDYAGGNGAKWDKSAGTFTIAGILTATAIASGSTLTVSGNIESNGFDATHGWRIWGNGNASFHDLSIGGEVGCITLASTGTVSASVLESSTVIKLSANYSSAGLRTLYSDDGVRLLWRDKNNGVHILT